MIVIAIPNIIQQKGLASLIRETDASIKTHCLSSNDVLNQLISYHKPSVVYVHSSLLKELTSHHINNEELRIIRVINEKPDSLSKNTTSFDILYLDDAEAIIIKNIKRNLALSTKQDKSSDVTENKLSEREKGIVREIALGRTNKEIADNLFISAHTVITHRKNITRKLGIKTVSGLTVYAILNKFIQMEEM